MGGSPDDATGLDPAGPRIVDSPLTERPRNVTVQLSATGGLFEGSVVTYRGVKVGKVASLKKLVDEQNFDLTKVFDSHAGIAHTRWATHGPPSRVNCHPHRYVILPLQSAACCNC